LLEIFVNFFSFPAVPCTFPSVGTLAFQQSLFHSLPFQLSTTKLSGHPVKFGVSPTVAVVARQTFVFGEAIRYYQQVEDIEV